MRTIVRKLTRMTQATDHDGAPLGGTQPGDNALLTTSQAAARLGISRRKLMELIYAREIETIRLPSGRTGRPYEHRVEPAEIKRFIDRYRQPAKTA